MCHCWEVAVRRHAVGRRLTARCSCRVEDYEEGSLFPCNSCGTLQYLAPEALGDTRHVDSSVDVYAFGILMWELLTGCPPYMLLSHEDILEEVGAAWVPSIPHHPAPTHSACSSFTDGCCTMANNAH
jgi:serine/threonine protein kinase